MTQHYVQTTNEQADAYIAQIGYGLKDYLEKSGLTKVLVGSSGGIDSALTIALAAHAIGPQNVTAITMPSAFSSPGSVTDSQALCENLGVELLTCPIGSIVEHLCESMRIGLGQDVQGVALENLQARARAVLLMTYSNIHGHLVLSTSNKSEISVGYCTLYGDTCGGLNLIGNLYKTEVYAVARRLNALSYRAPIPEQIIDKAPSAELAAGQKDSDSLPAYDVLDCALRVAQGTHAEAADALDYLRPSMTEAAIDDLVERVEQLIEKSAFKRALLPPAIDVSGVKWERRREKP